MKRTIAICVLIAVAIGLGSFYWVKEQRECKEAEYNYQVIRKGLLILSEEYNKGTEKVQYLKEYEETKSLKNINNILLL